LVPPFSYYGNSAITNGTCCYPIHESNITPAAQSCKAVPGATLFNILPDAVIVPLTSVMIYRMLFLALYLFISLENGHFIHAFIFSDFRLFTITQAGARLSLINDRESFFAMPNEAIKREFVYL
jgi:hypothetical protein